MRKSKHEFKIQHGFEDLRLYTFSLAPLF